MSEIIEEYYAQTKVMPVLVKQKIGNFWKYPDISAEFEYWIEKKAYKAEGISVNGYTAQKLACLSEFIDGEGAFMLLIELRENPEKALQRIVNGFKLK